MTLGERISEARKQKNYSQEYIAHELDISRQAVYKWEKGLSRPDTAHLIKLASLLNVTVEYLANGKTDGTVLQNSEKTRKKRSRFFKAAVSVICVFTVMLISSVAFIATRPVSFDAAACSGGFKTHIWDKYKDALFEKYMQSFADDNCTRELIENSQDVAFEDKTIIFFFDVAVTDENGERWTDYIHIKGKRIWFEKYVLENCFLL